MTTEALDSFIQEISLVVQESKGRIPAPGAATASSIRLVRREMLELATIIRDMELER